MSHPHERPTSRDQPSLASMANSQSKDSQLRAPSSPRLASHRQSFHEHLRAMPSSPRAHRQRSLSQQQFQELINNPPVGQREDTKFAGRDWKSVTAGEVIDEREVRFVELDTSVEDATNVGRLSML